ncbi:MAG: subclass B3 metallo-beta-lactamase [Pseudomonadota bacterium]
MNTSVGCARVVAVVLYALVFVACGPINRLERANVVDDGNDWITACGPNDPWDKPGPPYRIYGNTYYVGTCGIAAILIAGDQGHILLDAGTARGGEIIAANIAALGFDVRDVEILLHSHEHFDHVGGLALLRSLSGARVIASVAAAPVLESGVSAADDPQSGMHTPFAPVPVAATIADGSQVELGELSLRAIETPGHTPGALSWFWQSCDGRQCKTIAYLDSLSPISRDNYRFRDHPQYVLRYRAGLAKLADIDCDFALTPHPVASAMHQRLSSPSGLEDRAGCQRYVERIRKRLDMRLLREREGRGD